MRLKKIGHVVLKVRDLRQAEAFYAGVLGFEVVTRYDRPSAVFLSLGKQHHDIALFEVSRNAIEPMEDQVGLHHVALQIENFEALKNAYAELKHGGIQMLGAVDHGTTNSIYFRDPAGNRLELYCDVGTDGLARQRRKTARSAENSPLLTLDD